MLSLSLKWLTLCAITTGLLGLWVGAVTYPDVPEETSNSDDSTVQIKDKRVDNMQYFGRLGKRRDSFIYGTSRLGRRSQEKRPDPAMFGHLGKREGDEDMKRLDSKSFFGRLGKRDSVGTDISDNDVDKRGYDSAAFSGRLGKRNYDAQAYFGRLGKRTDSESDAEAEKRYDSRMFSATLGKKSLSDADARVLLQKLAELTKRGVDPMAYFSRLDGGVYPVRNEGRHLETHSDPATVKQGLTQPS